MPVGVAAKEPDIRLELHGKQSLAFLSEATEILYGGAAGGGKSHLLRVAAIGWCAAIAGLQVYLFRRNFPDLVKNHLEGPCGFPSLLAPFVSGKWVRINYSDHTITFWNGAKIYLCHCQHPSDVYRYQGSEMHVLLIDELTHFQEDMYRFLRGRVRMAGISLPAELAGRFPRIVCGSNPGGLGHNWVRGAFIDDADSFAIRRMPPEEGGMLRQYVPALLRDNPSLALRDPCYCERLAGLKNPALVRAMRDGDWNIVSGGAFDDIWRPEVHVVEPFAIPSSWRIDRSFDWGSSKPFSVGWWAESDGTHLPGGRQYPPGTLFRVAELYGWNGKPNEGARMLSGDIAAAILRKERELFPGRTVLPGPADGAIYDAADGTSIGAVMEARGVRWELADKRPGSRKSGFEKVRSMLAAALRHPLEDAGLFVFSSCRHFIRTIPLLPRSSSDPDDVDTNAEDHVYDEVRYRCMDRKRTTGEVLLFS